MTKPGSENSTEKFVDQQGNIVSSSKDAVSHGQDWKSVYWKQHGTLAQIKKEEVENWININIKIRL